MNIEKTAFQINDQDNVATALEEICKGDWVKLTGECSKEKILAAVEIPTGHKIALKHIKNGEEIIKYGIVIGRATAEIAQGEWVHLHVMKSIYDERSSHLDIKTGAPKDTKYE